MHLVALALDEFSKLHDGRKPSEIVLTRAATVAIAADTEFKPDFTFLGIPVKVADFDGTEAVEPGTGTRLGMFVNDNQVQLHVCVVDLR
jgi:hypothetical protein